MMMKTATKANPKTGGRKGCAHISGSQRGSKFGWSLYESHYSRPTQLRFRRD